MSVEKVTRGGRAGYCGGNEIWKRRIEGAYGPFRTKRTPDQRVGSPGVRLMNTPCGQAYFRLENSTSKFCFLTVGKVDNCCGAIVIVVILDLDYVVFLACDPELG